MLMSRQMGLPSKNALDGQAVNIPVVCAINRYRCVRPQCFINVSLTARKKIT